MLIGKKHLDFLGRVFKKWKKNFACYFSAGKIMIGKRHLVDETLGKICLLLLVQAK